MSATDPPSQLGSIVATYRAAYAEHGDSPRSLLYRDGRRELRYDALTSGLPVDRRCSVLDFGCGLAHLRDYLASHPAPVDYTGADVVPEFVAAAAERHPADEFRLITTVDDLDGRWDHVIVSGTFNLRYEADERANFDYLATVLTALFARATVSMSCDFMTEHVDFRHAEAHHQSIGELTAFVTTRLTRRFRIDQSYLPYEFALTAYVDDERADAAALYRRPVPSR